MLFVGHVKYAPRYVSKRAPGYNVVYRTSVPDAAAAINRGVPRRLASIDETHSATIVNETSETAASSSQKDRSDAEALLPETSKHSKSYSKKGRGQLTRQDAKADAKAAAPVQPDNSSEL